MSKKSWHNFPISYPPPKRGFTNGCLKLDEVTHIAHVTDAIRIIEDRRIRSSLVYDESCLNTKRTQVSWVSPKTWAYGYIYGNVAFAFDWSSLVKGKKLYWVEHRQTSGQNICRFLISDGDFTDHPVTEYDCTRPHGPLFYDAKHKTWFHNNNVTSEYMVLSDLQLSDCSRICFVDHHPRYCNKSGSACLDLKRSHYEAGIEVICKLIGTGQTHAGPLFASKSREDTVDSSVEDAVSMIYRQIVEKFDEDRTGTITKRDRLEAMKAIFLAAGWGYSKRVKVLLAQFPSKKAVETAFWDCIDEYFSGLKVSRN
jgi:hypothetical protein